MSLLTTGMIGHSFMRPGFNTDVDIGGTITASSSVVVTPAAAIPEGELIVVLLGGESNVTITVLPSGFTEVPTDGSGRLNSLCYKFATGSEPANYTFTLSGNMTNGGWAIFSCPYVDTDNPILYHDGVSGSSVNSISLNYDALGLAIGFSYIAQSAEEIWTANNGFSTVEAGDRFRLGVRVYNSVLRNQTLTWNGPGLAGVSLDLVILRGRKII